MASAGYLSICESLGGRQALEKQAVDRLFSKGEADQYKVLDSMTNLQIAFMDRCAQEKHSANFAEDVLLAKEMLFVKGTSMMQAFGTHAAIQEIMEARELWFKEPSRLIPTRKVQLGASNNSVELNVKQLVVGNRRVQERVDAYHQFSNYVYSVLQPSYSQRTPQEWESFFKEE